MSLRDLAGLSPFFALDTHAPGSPPREPWRPMGELIDDPGPLAERVAAVRAHLAMAGGLSPDDIEPRVAASVTHLGLTARLLSPVLAVAVINRAVLDVDLRRVRWQPVLGGGFPLSVPADAADPSPGIDDDELVAGMGSRVVNGPIRELTEATDAYSVSPQVLWGNVASALNGAATMIAAAKPEFTTPARQIVAQLLACPPLDTTSSTPPGPTFRRRSCCLIYRAAPNATGPTCADCVLTP